MGELGCSNLIRFEDEYDGEAGASLGYEALGLDGASLLIGYEPTDINGPFIFVESSGVGPRTAGGLFLGVPDPHIHRGTGLMKCYVTLVYVKTNSEAKCYTTKAQTQDENRSLDALRLRISSP